MLSNISGFPEFLPKEQIVFNHVIRMIQIQFERFGFSPLDTPAVEKVTTLLSKGNDHEIYGLYRLADETPSHKKDLALRFDLTVPLARYVAQHYDQLYFPYRRYHIAPVWRGERPQAGRYRQFYQCDIDIVGEGELSLTHDAEILSVLYNILRAIGLDRFIIQINNRYILTGLLQSLGVLEEQIANVMRVIDKAEKITKDVLQTELNTQGLSESGITLVLTLLSKQLSHKEWILYLQSLCQNEEFQKGILELEEVIQTLKLFGIPEHFIQIQPALARGLNYYTGTVFEAKLIDYPELGSICSGGRYANLADSFTRKKLPGVGGSIGISRLIPKLLEIGILKAETDSPATILVTTQNPIYLKNYIEIAQSLRSEGINTELYLAEKPLAAQMKYAGKKGYRFAIIADQSEFEAHQVIVRNMKTGVQQTILQAALIDFFAAYS